MEDSSLLLVQIYGGGYTLGLLPFVLYVLLQRRIRMSLRLRTSLSAAVALATATPVFYVPGWIAVFLPVSLGYWLAPGLLEWTLTQVIPETVSVHLASAAVTTVIGGLVGWWVRPLAANNSPMDSPRKHRSTAG